MPVQLVPLLGQRLVFSRYIGTVTPDELSCAYNRVMRPDEHWATFREVCDLSELTPEKLGPQAVRDMAERCAAWLTRRGWNRMIAYLAPADTLHGLASIYRAQAEFNGVEDVAVLRSLDEVAELLGLEIDDLRRQFAA